MFQTRSSMLLSARVLVLILTVMALSSCGFKPLYAKKEKTQNYKSCNNFTVNKVKSFGVSGQKLQYKLQDALNQACINSATDYKVTIDMTKTKDAAAIEKNREITRYNIKLNAGFSVVETAKDKIVYTGHSTMVGGFDAQVSDYGTYALEEDTQKKLIEELANDIALKVSSVLLRK